MSGSAYTSRNMSRAVAAKGILCGIFALTAAVLPSPSTGEVRIPQRLGGARRRAWGNPLWATPNTDLYWSAKEQPNHSDTDWSAKKQSQSQPVEASGRYSEHWNGGPSASSSALSSPSVVSRPSGSAVSGRPPVGSPSASLGAASKPVTTYGAAKGTTSSGGKFCGKSWSSLNNDCDPLMAKECPSGTDADCDEGSSCFEVEACVYKPKYCGTSWSGLQGLTCGQGVQCRSGLDEDCPDGLKCFAGIECKPDIPAVESTPVIGNKPKPSTRPPTRPPTKPPTIAVASKPISPLVSSSSSSSSTSSTPEVGASDMISNLLNLKPPPTPPSKRPTPNPVMTWLPKYDSQPTPEVLGSKPAPTQPEEEDDWSLTNQLYLQGYLRSSYYCGSTYNGFNADVCQSATPCPDGMHQTCPGNENCYPDTPCAFLKTPNPTPPPVTSTPRPTFPLVEGDASKRFCGYSWQDVIANCLTAIPCPEGFAEVACPAGMKCIADTPCGDPVYISYLKGDAEPIPAVAEPTNPPAIIREGDPMKRYCGVDWSDVTSNCLSATPCPLGFSDVCPDGHQCINETPCGDEAYLEWLNSRLNGDDNAVMQSKPANDAPDQASIVDLSCQNDAECPVSQFCNSGACGTCSLSSQSGCAADEVCLDKTCTALSSEATCYSADTLDRECKNYLKDMNAGCDVVTMQCETYNANPSTLSEQPPSPSAVDSIQQPLKISSVYRNPEDNDYFCGDNYSQVISQCLASKPCANGVSFGVCGENQGCFLAPVCAQEYEFAVATQPPTQSATEPVPEIGTKPKDDEPISEQGSSLSPFYQLDICPGVSTESLSSAKSVVVDYSYTLTIDDTAVVEKVVSDVEDFLQESLVSNKCSNRRHLRTMQEFTYLGFSSNPNDRVSSDCGSQVPAPSKQCSLVAGEFTAVVSNDVEENAVLQDLKAYVGMLLSDSSNPSVETNFQSSMDDPSKSPSIEPTWAPSMSNTNYCGASWSAVNNVDDCSWSTPCPTGDECPAGQTCFAGSPCAALLALEQDEQTPSKVGNYCGSSWNSLLVECESARPCPQGNECGEGEMCYRNFVCDPPETLTPTKKVTPAPSVGAIQNTAAQKLASSPDLHQGSNQEETLSSNTASTYEEYLGENTVGGSEASTPSSDSTSSARAEATDVATSSGSTPSPLQVSGSPTTCSLCGDAGVNSNSVGYNGRTFPCDGFQDVFVSNDVQDGSELCLNFRKEYSNSCCFGQSQDTQEPQETLQNEAPCLLCALNGKEYEVARDVTVILSDGAEQTCLALSQFLLDIPQMSDQCTETKVTMFRECCGAEAVPVNTQQSSARSPGVSEANRLGGGLVKSPPPSLTGFYVGDLHSDQNDSSHFRGGNLIVTIVMGFGVPLLLWYC